MSEPYVGEIKAFGFDFAPRGYAACNGQLLAINQNQALFALLGTTYGGDGITTFALPDLRGRTPVHVGSSGPVLGQPAGVENVTLTSLTMPTHTHLVQGTSTTANQRTPAGAFFANDSSPAADFFAPGTGAVVPIASTTLSSAGGSQPHDNMQPFLVINYCIALMGVFPSRN